MSKIKLTIPALALFFIALCSTTGRAQQFEIDPVYYTIFDQDSLSGFNESEARAVAIYERFLGSEFKIKMYRSKREYINKKYNLVSKTGYQNSYFNGPLVGAKPTVVPGCTNEDFESSVAGVITTSNQIAGWTVVEGYNGYVGTGSASSLTAAYPSGLTGATSCNLLGCCPLPPSHSELIDCSAPGGYIDNTIGNQYPIFSVFGTGTVTGATASNTQITQGMFGTKVLRLNDENTGDYSLGKLAKTFSVSASNALFQFAFISVFSPGHGCCDAGGFQIKLYDNGPSASGTPSTITCPNFSVSAPSSACTATVPMQYYVVQSWTPHNNNNYNNIYNPWKISSMDLSAYINKYITIEIIVSDCTAGGHFGCVYFDAQCGPMTVYGNGNAYDAGANVTVPTCGAAGATICAADGLGPYSWAGSGLTPDQGVPSMTNQCITTTISSTYTLYMQPQGACVPIQRVVQSSITPAPLLLVSALQAQCNGTTAVVSVTPSGSASNPSYLIWSPTPFSINTTTTQGTYIVPATGGSNQTLVTVSAADPLGCKVTATINVNPAPPLPSFTLNNVTNSASITCVTPSVDLTAVTNYTYGTLSYFWASSNSTYSTQAVNVVNPGNFTVTGTDLVTNCAVQSFISVGVNTIVPTSNVSPLTQNITCSLTSVTNVSLTSSSPTINITHLVISPQNATFVSTSALAQYPPGGTGTYTYILRNDENGCITQKEFTVTSAQVFPTFGVSSPQSYTLGCNATSVAIVNIVNPQGSGGGGATYTVAAPGSSVPAGLLSTGTSFSVNNPGTYTVIVRDNANSCQTNALVSILSNTFLPDRSVVKVRDVLTCYDPKVTLYGKSLTAGVEFYWNFPGSLGTQQGDSLVVNSLTASANTSSVVGDFTLNVNNLSSTCKSTSVVTIYQNLYKPNAVVSGLKVLTCKVATITLNNQSNPTTPSNTLFASGKAVSGLLWEGPSPQEPKSNSTSYVAATVGDYTLTAIDLNNGCTNTTTYNVADGKIYPIVTIKNGTLSCGTSNDTVFAIVNNFPKDDQTYFWKAEGVNSPSASVNSEYKYVVNQTGNYIVLVTNKLNGCAFTTTANVVSDSLTANFEADKYTGFAPLTVNFRNLSSSTTGTANIKSIWDLGNGFAADSTTKLSTAFTVYKQPGTYTVTLYTNKGECMERAYKIIKVDIPSSVTIPNVFTPNGDGVNDVYFIKAANLTNVDAVIYDRWGHIVYELKNDKGRIEWDGKNQYGKESAEGTYFYVIKATGSDGVEYNEKGTINLYR